MVRRRIGEAIAIGENIEIEVIEISRSRVKLGVRAPRTTSVVRRETVPIAAENRSASEFIGTRGFQDLEEILRMTRKISEIAPKGSDRDADKYAEDTAGIPNESGEPGPGTMTGTYQAKDPQNV